MTTKKDMADIEETRPRLIIANAFSLSMLPLTSQPPTPNYACVKIKKLSKWEAWEKVQNVVHGSIPAPYGRIPISMTLDCAIGHESTARLASQILGVELKCERKMIELTPKDTLLVIQLTIRPPEGKIYSEEELRQLLNEGKIAFYEVRYAPPPLF